MVVEVLADGEQTTRPLLPHPLEEMQNMVVVVVAGVATRTTQPLITEPLAEAVYTVLEEVVAAVATKVTEPLEGVGVLIPLAAEELLGQVMMSQMKTVVMVRPVSSDVEMVAEEGLGLVVERLEMEEFQAEAAVRQEDAVLEPIMITEAQEAEAR